MEKKVLSAEEKKVLRSMFWRSHLTFVNFNMVKMEANGFTITMTPAIESIYKDDPEGKKEAYLRHQNFFNTHAVPFAFIAGLSYAMEKEHKENGSVDGQTIESIKAALMGPTAGMFDSLFFNCLRVIAAGIGIGLCEQGNILGTFLFILIYGVSQLVGRWYLLRIGYSFGTSFIDSIFESGLMEPLTKSAGIVGLTMVGAMVATTVKVKLNWTIAVGQTSVVVLDIIESIMPGLLSIVLVFVLVRLIKKGVKPITLVFGILALTILLAAVGVF